jgi:hypothetical protein
MRNHLPTRHPQLYSFRLPPSELLLLLMVPGITEPHIVKESALGNPTFLSSVEFMGTFNDFGTFCEIFGW